MKIANSKTIAFLGLLGLLSISCNNSPAAKEQDLTEAEQDVLDAKADFDQATYDSIKDFNAYKESVKIKFVANEKSINNLKANIGSKSRVDKDIDEVEINRLEAKNEELKSKIENYEQGPTQRWELLKADFNREVDDLGKAISEKAEQNAKK